MRSTPIDRVAILSVCTATEQVDLLVDANGIHSLEWAPSTPPVKGTWVESPFTQGRQPVMRQFGNVIDTFTIVTVGPDMDTAILRLRAAQDLLEKASAYWMDEWNTTPVWIKVRGAQETNTRYAYVYDYGLPNGDDPFTTPFADNSPSAIEGLTLGIEHGLWRDTPPGDPACVKVSAFKADVFEASLVGVPSIATDDAYVWPANIDTAGMNLWMGKDGGGVSYSAGVRFRNLAIPPDAVILKAYVLFYAASNQAGDNANLLISAENAVSPAAFSTNADFWGRPRVVGAIAWHNIPHWVAASMYSCVDVSALIQNRVLTANGWVSGHNIVLFFQDDGSSVGAYRDAGSISMGAGPFLYIEYVTSTGATRSMGQVTPVCTPLTFFANHFTKTQLTHIFWEDNSTGIWSANLCNLSNQNLMPAAPAANDALYFGISRALWPFFGVFNNIVIPMTSYGLVTTSVLQYWNGGWVAFTPGVNCSITPAGGIFNGVATPANPAVYAFAPFADWAPSVINGITAYWVRIVITVAGGGPVVPVSAGPIYTCNWPYIEIASTELTGDIASLIDFTLYPYGILGPNWYLLGARSTIRGADFTAYLTCSNVHLPAGASWSAPLLTTSFLYPAGQVLRYSPAGAGSTTATLTMTSALAAQYPGRYHIYIRANLTAGVPTDLNFTLSLAGIPAAPTPIWETPQVMQGATHFGITDLGIWTIPAMVTNFANLYFTLTMYAGAALTIDLVDLILMPVDEMVINPYSKTTWMTGIATKPYYHCSTGGKGVPITELHDAAGLKEADLKTDILGLMALPPKRTIRLWGLCKSLYQDTLEYNLNAILSEINLDGVDQYLLYRGAS